MSFAAHHVEGLESKEEAACHGKLDEAVQRVIDSSVAPTHDGDVAPGGFFPEGQDPDDPESHMDGESHERNVPSDVNEAREDARREQTTLLDYVVEYKPSADPVSSNAEPSANTSDLLSQSTLEVIQQLCETAEETQVMCTCGAFLGCRSSSSVGCDVPGLILSWFPTECTFLALESQAADLIVPSEGKLQLNAVFDLETRKVFLPLQCKSCGCICGFSVVGDQPTSWIADIN